MPMTTPSGKADKQELPSTLQRSPAKAQRTSAKVHDAAAEQYGEGERAHRTAYAALKQYEIARRLDASGLSSMSKDELVTAIGRANDRASAKCRKH